MIRRCCTFLFFLLGPCLLWGQSSPLTQPVDIAVRNTPLKEVLQQLITRENVYLSYRTEIIPDLRIDLQLQDAPLKKVLDRLLRATDLTYQVVGQQVILYEQPPGPSEEITFSVSGYVTDSLSGEALSYALVKVAGTEQGVVTNPYGYFSIQLPRGPAVLEVSYIGYEARAFPIAVEKDMRLSLELGTHLLLTEILVSSAVEERGLFRDPNSLAVDLLDELPRLGGEADLVRMVYAQAGVQTDADGLGGMHVRGGGRGENLVLVDGVPVYELMHAGGLVSIFNANAIRSATLHKGTFPARYGGRLSSTLDLRTKEGNLKYWTGNAHASLIATGVSLEGPIIKDRLSLLVSGRASLVGLYLDPLVEALESDPVGDRQLNYRFYDFNGKLSYVVSDRDRLYLSVYNGRDYYRNENQRADSLNISGTPGGGNDLLFTEYNSESFRWGNTVAVARWNHVLSPNLFTNFAFSYSRLDSRGLFLDSDSLIDLASGNTPVLSSDQREISSGISDLGIRSDWDWMAGNSHHVRFGVGYTRHHFRPQIRRSDEEGQVPLALTPARLIRANEWWAFLEDDWTLGPKMWMNLGLRYGGWENQGKTFHSLEPRLEMNYLLNSRWLLRGGFGLNSQFVHLLSNFSLGLPTDLWVPTTAETGFQRAWQISLGSRYKLGAGWQVEVDAYYRNLNRLLSLAEGLEPSDNWEEDVVTGHGNALGLEATLRVNRPRFNGWLAYSLGRTDRQFDGVNFGRRYPFRFDRRHQIDLALSYRINSWLSVSGQWALSSGVAFNFPSEQFEFNYPGLPSQPITAIDFGDKNEFRMPWYHRLDLGLDFVLRQQSTTEHRFHLGVYNLYNRRNPLFFRLQSRVYAEEGTLVERKEVEQVSLFPLLPSLSYALHF